MNAPHPVLTLLVLALVTAFVRFLPFWLMKRGKKLPRRGELVIRSLPYASMGMLTVYCLKDVSFLALTGWLPPLLACLVTAGVHLLKKNTLISIVCGTAVYMILIRVM